jgi:hypothetical protein
MPLWLRITCYALRVTHYVLRITCYALRVTHYVLRVTCYVLRVTCYAGRQIAVCPAIAYPIVRHPYRFVNHVFTVI